MEKTAQEKGVALFLAVLIMSVILAIGLGISGILIQQIKISENIGDSVVAFYAADAGIEQQIYDLYKEETHSSSYNAVLVNNASYEVSAMCGPENSNCLTGIPTALEEECDSSNNYCIRSVGTFQATKRAIEVNY
ncbi:hypothetical protein FJY90_06805 [Candidatus Gottesmanbacteria bacterium]|nr:hypothetical protein [Candidatus Gottesmanbacteria bacterium]